MHVDVRELPDTVQRALKALGYGKRDISVEVSNSFTIIDGGGAGTRSFWAIVNIATGKYHVEQGSWGGANMFNPRNPVDLDDTPRPLPPGSVVIKGSKGNGPVYAYIIASPQNVPLLTAPAGSDEPLTEKEKSALNIVGSIISGYRKDEFARAGLGPYAATNPILQSLASKGLVKITGVGVQITTKGKNMRGNHRMASDRVASRYVAKVAGTVTLVDLERAMKGQPIPIGFEVYYQGRDAPVTYTRRDQINFSNVRRITLLFPPGSRGHGTVDGDSFDRNRQRVRPQ